MKKFFTIIAGTVMLASVSSAFASPLTCPKPQDIRSSGSIFTHAFVVEGYNWALISNPFTFDNHEWQTSKDAVVLGSKEFDSTPLWNEPNADTLGNKTICTYIAMQDGVMVTAISPADWGFKKR